MRKDLIHSTNLICSTTHPMISNRRLLNLRDRRDGAPLHNPVHVRLAAVRRRLGILHLMTSSAIHPRRKVELRDQGDVPHLPQHHSLDLELAVIQGERRIREGKIGRAFHPHGVFLAGASTELLLIKAKERHATFPSRLTKLVANGGGTLPMT
jgi:hypothetical protein